MGFRRALAARVEGLHYVRGRYAGLALARALWRLVVRNYCCEVCTRCGRPTGTMVKNEPMSWWAAPDDLWETVEGGPGGLRCHDCFTRDCAEQGIHIRWEAIVDA